MGSCLPYPKVQADDMPIGSKITNGAIQKYWIESLADYEYSNMGLHTMRSFFCCSGVQRPGKENDYGKV